MLGTLRDDNSRMENNLHDGIVQVNVSMIRVHVYMSITALLFECNGYGKVVKLIVIIQLRVL